METNAHLPIFKCQKRCQANKIPVRCHLGF
uniref:Uncharacterized protein n=1 Tax=Anguilla anguilla TaxID=7936 RepID=A0A0E9TQE1_ANGAN